MGVFKMNKPSCVGETENDVNALHRWACMLIDELRQLFYDLDATNIRSVKAEDIKGIILPQQIREAKKVSIHDTIAFVDEEGNEVASMHYDKDKKGICVNVNLYVGGEKVRTEGS